MNEYITIFITINEIFYTDIVEYDMQFDIGWWAIAEVFFIIFVNIAIVLYYAFR